MKTNRNLPIGMVILGISFLLGGLLGCFFASLISGEGESIVAESFLAYFSAVKEGRDNPNFWLSLWHNLKPPLLAFFLGFSFLGIIGLPLLFATEGFIFTFSLSILCRLWGITGLIPSFFVFCLPALLWMPLFFLLGFQSFYAAMILWGRGKKEEAYPKGYFFRSFLCLSAILFSSAFECFLLPLLLQGIL